MVGVNEWGDPRPILEEDKKLSESEQRRVTVEGAVADAYSQQFTTTPIDSRCRFTLQFLNEVECDGQGPVYEFQVKRFRGFLAAGTFTGVVEQNGDEWVVDFDTPDSDSSTIVSWVRSLL